MRGGRFHVTVFRSLSTNPKVKKIIKIGQHLPKLS